MALDEGVDDAWGLVPPDGVAEQHHLVLAEVYGRVLDGWAALRVLHLQGAARLLVVPVEVVGGVGALRGYGNEVASGEVGEALRRAGRGARGREVHHRGGRLARPSPLLCAAAQGGEQQERQQGRRQFAFHLSRFMVSERGAPAGVPRCRGRLRTA